VSALVTMYGHEEDIDSAIDVFSHAIEHYQAQQVGPLYFFLAASLLIL